MEGRFAKIDVPRNFSAPTRNAFGYVTEPYSANDAAFLTRSASVCGFPTTSLPLSGCDELKGTFAQTTMSQFHPYTEFLLHLPLHPILGGAWDCASSLRDLAELDASGRVALDVGTFAASYMSLVFTHFAEGLSNCPSTCDADGSSGASDCRCRCDDVDGADLEKWLELSGDDFEARASIYDAFKKHVYEPLHRLDEKTGSQHVARLFAKENNTEHWAFRNQVHSHDFEAALEVAAVKLTCSPGKLSPFFSPLASANDPIFWPLHNNWERNWAYMRIYKHLNSTWTNSFRTIAPSTDDDSITWTTNKGWNFHDPVYPFGDGLVRGAPPPKGAEGVYTNAELVDLFDPTSSHLPYVWDDFAYDHCK